MSNELKSNMLYWLCDELENGFEPDFETFCDRFYLDDVQENYYLYNELYEGAQDVLTFDVDFLIL